ncbi:cytochrome c oxidase assembly protein COX18, mitochondrial [Hemicordylus capensis]|uniref:cytochrome c oxidase assembly protein COX18, mitochondrial n=1 Tax=Hemicordylus capensis TaxID=884348 RepID=UPI002303244B|nr:cytochrome c oxidase assembly protein COX18, mitochondrial [Hemicordylus capensis]
MAARVGFGILAFSPAARALRNSLLLRCMGARALSVPASPGHDPLSPGWGWYEALSSSAPVICAESSLAALQAASGLPWWATVVAASAALRTGVTLPLAAQQGRVLAKLENLQPEIQSLAKHLRYEVSVCAKQQGWSEKLARVYFKKNLKRIVSELYIRDNCHPFKASLLIWIQIPMWVFVSIALRNFSVGRAASEGVSIQEQLSTGGTLWFMDLTIPDSTWILPITLGLLNLLIVEIFALRKTELSRFQKYITNFFRGMSLLMIPVAATVPSSIALYWVSSSFMGLLHNLLLRSPTFRRLCHVPRTKSDSETPYRDIVASFYAKYFLK